MKQLYDTGIEVGVAISYAGFNLRKLVSATSFTVVGVVCLFYFDYITK